MIRVTQGHERSVSLEVFFKSLLLLPAKTTYRQITLYGSQKSLKKNLEQLGFTYSLLQERLDFYGHQIYFRDVSSKQHSESLDAILEAVKDLQPRDILVTLPTSKDQLVLDGRSFLGHTELFRHLYKEPLLPMFFYSKSLKTMLLTDHVPLSGISELITTERIYKMTAQTIQGFQSFYGPLEEVLFSGVNPHAGEGGLLGHEESLFEPALKKLGAQFPQLRFVGPKPADTLHLYRNPNRHQIFVYAYHDQGLNVFKQSQRFIGINTTFGMPYFRLSPDHGTAFDLWGKNMANPLGCHDVLLLALNKGSSHAH